MSTTPPPDVARITFEELAVRVDLPLDWELEVDTDHAKVTSVGNDTPWCDPVLCPSITLTRMAFEGDTDAFKATIDQSLQQMPGNYEQFKLRWTENPVPRVSLRCYSFWSAQLELTIVQLQGFVEAANDLAVYVVHASAPERSFDQLESLYRHVVLSIEPLGSDYVAPDDEDEEDAG